MSGLTEEQRKLYDKLQSAIGNRGDVAGILAGVSREDLLTVLCAQGTTIEYKNGKKATMPLVSYVVAIKNQEGLKAILNAAEGKDIAFEGLVNGECVTIDAPNVVKFDGIPLEVEQACKIFYSAVTSNMWRKAFVDEINTNGVESFDEEDEFKDFVDTGGKNALEGMKAALKETGHYDHLNQVLRYEAKMAANKAMKIGGVCGVVAALAVGIGCGVGTQLPILAIVGIAVAAAVAVGLIAYGITYAVSKPSYKLENVDVQEQDKVPSLI